MASTPDPILRCVAVDDEPFALRLISDEISKVPFLQLVQACASASQARKVLEEEKIDLLFLDIQMPELTGTEFLRTLENPLLVIFTTAYEQYALEGFELDVVDYLVKPIPFDRFLKAVTRAKEQFVLQQASSASPRDKFFFVRAEYKEVRIMFDDILYVEGLKDYVKIFLASQTRPILTRLNLKAIEARLPARQFCRVHNSFIIPFARIDSFQRAQIFIGTTAIPVGDKYAESFRERYKPEE